MARENKSSFKKYIAIVGIIIVILAAVLLLFLNRSSGNRDFTIKDGVVTAYRGDSSIVKIPDQATSIDSFVFMNHEEIKKVIIGGRCKTIGEGAFYGCTNLKDLKLASSVSYINDGAFGECHALTEFTVPRDCVYLNSGAFYNDTGIREFKVEKGNKTFTAVDGVLYLEDMTAIVDYPLARDAAEYEVADGVTFIASWSFFGATKLEKIVLPETVTEIGEEAFSNSGIKTMVLPDSVSSMGSGTFILCTELEEVTFGSGLEELPSSCFEGCEKLASVTIPETLTRFQTSCFASCGLGEVTFEGDIMYAETSSFGLNPDLVLCGAEGSNLQDYATNCQYTFKAIR